MTIGEAHVITTNPLLAPFLVKIVKMWRKLGAWLWSATQNMEDYPAAAKKMLNMVEWWLCLVMPKEESRPWANTASSTTASAMLLSASKAPANTPKGVMTERHEYLARNVPPSLMLASPRPKNTKKPRATPLMREHGCSNWRRR